jgi:hypothetical protein
MPTFQTTPITEDLALKTWTYREHLGADGVDLLSRYEKQQDDLGLPLWPSQMRQRIAEQDSMSKLFSGLDEVSKQYTDSSEFADAEDFDEIRAHWASRDFLASRYNTDLSNPDDVTRHMADYATKQWGDASHADSALKFYQRVGQDMAKEAALNESRSKAWEAGTSAALLGQDSVMALADFQRTIPKLRKGEQQDQASLAFSVAFQKVKNKANGVGDLADRMLVAAQQYTEMYPSDYTGDKPLMKPINPFADLEDDMVMLTPGQRKIVLSQFAAKAEKSDAKTKDAVEQTMNFLQRQMAGKVKEVLQNVPTVGTVVQNFPAMLANDMKPEEFDATDAAISLNEARGEVYASMRQAMEGGVAPIKPVLDWLQDDIETGMMKAPGAVLPSMMLTMAGGVYGGAALLSAQFMETNRTELREAGLSPADARLVSTVAAPFQGAIENLSNLFMVGKLPAVNRILSQFLKPIGTAAGQGALARYGINVAANVGIEFTEEQLQDNYIVPKVRDLLNAMGEDIGGPSWKFYEERAIAQTPELLSIIVPTSLLFAGFATMGQVNLSHAVVSDQRALELAGFSMAQANEIRMQDGTDARIDKARELWTSRAGNRQSVAAAVESLGAEMQERRKDVELARITLEQRGEQPAVQRTADGTAWQLYFDRDKSTATFATPQEAGAAALQYSHDMGLRIQGAAREFLTTAFNKLEPGRGLQAKFQIGRLTANQAKEQGIMTPEQEALRTAQADVLEGRTIDDAVVSAEAKDARSDVKTTRFVLGSSVNEMKHGIMTTVMKLWEGHDLRDLAEEKIEGDFKLVIADPKRRQWALDSLREYERLSGEKLFRDVAGSQLQDSDLVEAWSSLGRAVLLTSTSKGKGRNIARMTEWMMKAGLGGALNAESEYWNQVAAHANKVKESIVKGHFKGDVVALLEKQLGIDSQESHETAVADLVAAEMADTSSYSEENPGPNGETFSLAVQQRGGFPAKAGDRIKHGNFEATIYNVQQAKGAGYWVVFTDASAPPEWKHGERRTLAPFAKLIDGYSEPVKVLSRGNANTIPSGTAELEALKQSDEVQAETRPLPFRETPDSGLRYDAPKRGSLDPEASSLKVGDTVNLGGPQTIAGIEDRSHGFLWFNFEGGLGAMFHHGSRLERASKETFSLRKFPVPAGLAEAAKKARGESSLILAYQSAQRGSSSAMVPIRAVYEAAKKHAPALTPAAFMAQINALNDSGKILVGLSETTKAVEAAGEFRVGGAGTEMAFAPQEHRAPVESFSLRSGEFMTRMARAFDPWQKNPELRREVARVALARLQRLADDAVLDFGSKGKRAVPGIDSIAQLDWIDKETERLLGAWLDGMDSNARQTYEAGLQSIEDHPLIQEMRGQGLRIMRRATALKQGLNIVDGKETGDYNGMPNLPASLMAKPGTGMLPGNIAQAIHDVAPGLVADGYVDTLWDALQNAIASVEKRNAEFKEINAKVKAAKKKAAETAKKLAPYEPEFHAEQRQKLKAYLRALDAILSASPAGMVGRVGGYTKLASFTTDESMLREIERRIERMGELLERHLQKEYLGSIAELLEKFGSQTGAAGKPKSRTVAAVAEVVDFARAFSELEEPKQQGAIAELDAVLNDANSTAEQIDAALQKKGIAELFYNLPKANAERLSNVHQWLSTLSEEGLLQRKALDEERRAWVADMQAKASEAVMGKGVAPAELEEAQNVEGRINKSVWRKMVEKVKGMANAFLPSAPQLLEDIFGVEDAVADWAINAICEAANKATDIKRKMEKERLAKLAQVFGSTSRFTMLRRFTELQQVKTKTGVFIQKVKTDEIKLPLEILERIADGKADLKALGITREEADEALDQWAASAKKRSATITRKTNAGNPIELEMSEMQAAQYLLHLGQKENRERAERHGYNAETLKQLQAFISPETAQIMMWFKEQYRTTGYGLVSPVYRRLMHAPLPHIDNYAPAHYDQGDGKQSLMDLDGAGGGSGLNAGFTTSRKSHNRNIARADAATVFLQHFEHVAHWVSFVELVRDLRGVFQSEKVMNSIRAKVGPAAADALAKRIKAIETQGNNEAWSLGSLNQLAQGLNQVRAYQGLAFRLSPVLKQMPAMLNPMMGDIPAHRFAQGLARFLAGQLDVKAIWKSETIQRRLDGGFSAEARLAMLATPHSPTGAQAVELMRKGMLPMQYMDATWNVLGASVAYDYYFREAKAAGENDAMAHGTAITRTQRLVDRTAQPVEMVNRSMVEGISNPWAKAAFLFRSEARKNLAIEFYAIKRLATGKSKDKAMDFQRAFVAHVAQAVGSQLMACFIASLLGDDDDREREWSEKQWAFAILSGPINGLFVFGDIASMILRRSLGLRSLASMPPLEKAAMTLGSAGGNLGDLFHGNADEMMDEIDRLSSATAQGLGLFFGPVAGAPDAAANLLRDLRKASKRISSLSDD